MYKNDIDNTDGIFTFFIINIVCLFFSKLKCM